MNTTDVFFENGRFGFASNWQILGFGYCTQTQISSFQKPIGSFHLFWETAFLQEANATQNAKSSI